MRDTPFSVFDTRDISPIGYRPFGFMLGAAMGALVRRMIPAMVLTIAVFAAVRVNFNLYVRPHFASPLHGVFKFLPPGAGAKVGGGVSSADWVLSDVVKNAAGKVFPLLSHGVGFQPSANGSVTLVGAGRCPNEIPSLFEKARSTTSGPPKAVRRRSQSA